MLIEGAYEGDTRSGGGGGGGKRRGEESKRLGGDYEDADNTAIWNPPPPASVGAYSSPGAMYQNPVYPGATYANPIYPGALYANPITYASPFQPSYYRERTDRRIIGEIGGREDWQSAWTDAGGSPYPGEGGNGGGGGNGGDNGELPPEEPPIEPPVEETDWNYPDWLMRMAQWRNF